MPFKRSLATYKRIILSSVVPTTDLIRALLSLGFNDVRSRSDENFMTFVNELSGTGKVCSNIDKLSLVNLSKISLNPLEIIKNIVCYVIKTITTSNRALFDN